MLMIYQKSRGLNMREKVIYFLLFVLFMFSGCDGLETNGDYVKIKGRITFDRVHVKIDRGGIARLDYNNIEKLPSRGILVKAINVNGQTLDSTTTNSDGKYTLKVPINTDVKVRAYARMYKDGYWDVRVVDNTNNSALYVIDGSYYNSGTRSTVRNLHAISGWTGDGYGNSRVSAPFAILDSIYQAMEKVRRADKSAKFPQLTVNWSVNNVATPGDESSGQIITSNYDGKQNLWILGDENGDTDEFDDHIIIHEWGHYFEDQFSRADNIGGSHSLGEALDIRVAFGEGWGNAFSGIATDNPIYFDTSGYKQSTGWYMDLESGAQENPGWYSEGSIQRILYDLYDRTNEPHDKTSLGFRPIYKVLVGAERTTPAFTSLFTFIDALKRENSSYKREIDKTVGYENINSIIDAYGSNRTNRADIPLYKDLSVGGVVSVCTRNNFGVYNKLGNRVYIRVHIDSDGRYRFRADATSYDADPDFILYTTVYPHKELSISQIEGSPTDELIIDLKKGEYLIDIYDASFNNSCLNLSLNKEKIQYNQKGKSPIVSKIRYRRRLPKRQYY